jgi:flagellar motor protein MotB
MEPFMLRERIDLELEQELGQTARGAGQVQQRPMSALAETSEYFVTRILPGLREGHEVLTREAAAGAPGVDLPALLRGVTRVDSGGGGLSLPGALIGSLVPAQQRRHALRAELCQPVSTALSQIRNHLVLLHARAMGARTRSAAFEQIGEALHLIQDSYSDAHVQRNFGAGPRGTHPIQYIRFFGFLSRLPPRTTSAPREHGFPADDRDQITDSRGRRRPETRIAVNASREYLLMAMRHLTTPTSPTNAREVRAFLDRHLFLSRRPDDVRSFHPQCGSPPITPNPIRPVTPVRPPVRRPIVLDRFGLDQAVLTPAHRLVIDRLARQIIVSWRTARPIRAIRLVGHTDNSGPDSYNLALGQRRAQAAQQELARAIERLQPGLTRRILFQILSEGERRPAATNNTPDGRTRNRRVVISV